MRFLHGRTGLHRPYHQPADAARGADVLLHTQRRNIEDVADIVEPVAGTRPPEGPPNGPCRGPKDREWRCCSTRPCSADGWPARQDSVWRRRRSTAFPPSHARKPGAVRRVRAGIADRRHLAPLLSLWSTFSSVLACAPTLAELCATDRKPALSSSGRCGNPGGKSRLWSQASLRSGQKSHAGEAPRKPEVSQSSKFYDITAPKEYIVMEYADARLLFSLAHREHTGGGSETAGSGPETRSKNSAGADQKRRRCECRAGRRIDAAALGREPG